MIEVKGYYKDFMNSLNSILLTDRKDIDISIIELNILKIIKEFVKGNNIYYIPHHPEDYSYPSSNIVSLEINKSIVIESDIESYELAGKNTRIKAFTPTLYFYIKEKNQNFSELSLISNVKLRDNFILTVRQHNGLWQISPIVYTFLNDRFNAIELFKQRSFEYSNSQETIHIQENNKLILTKIHETHKKNFTILQNRNVDLLVYVREGIDYRIPAFCLTHPNVLDTNSKIRRVDDDVSYKGALDDVFYFGVRIK